MKKFVVSMGLAAAGSAAFQMTCAAQLFPTDGPKVWNVAGALSGFYDNNYNTGGSAIRKGSFGLEFSPTISAKIPLTQTEVDFLYTYDMQYYEERDHLNQNPIDQSHTFNLWVDHSFNEEWQAKFNDNFVSGQEPSLVAGGAVNRLEGNNIVNNASVELDTDWTREMSTALTYANTYVDYDNATYANDLNRDQNSIALDLQWHISPETTAFVGYQFQNVYYLENGQLDGSLVYTSPDRDNNSHFGYVGLQKNLLANLVVSGRVGVQYTDDYNYTGANPGSFGPYALVSLIYTYLPGSTAQLNFSQSRNATDVSTSTLGPNGSLTLNAESSVLSASINHRLSPKLVLSAIGTWSASTFNGGASADETDYDYSAGLGANYSFTRNITGNVNYNYDYLSSNISGRGYQRNRISIGLSVAY